MLLAHNIQHTHAEQHSAELTKTDLFQGATTAGSGTHPWEKAWAQLQVQGLWGIVTENQALAARAGQPLVPRHGLVRAGGLFQEAGSTGQSAFRIQNELFPPNKPAKGFK